MTEVDKSKYKFLFDINSPEDLRKIPESDIETVSNEVREFMVDTITKIGGHFGAGLGVVELSTALHYVYNTPKDKIIWDVGHQGYPHKILTGRRDQLSSIRQKGGISGFLKISESEYDCYGAGHASTSISAALGMAAARDIKGEDNRVIAIIGDGSMTGGLAFEGLNNCGFQNRDITVILNDNDMSIAPNVSAMSNYFNELFASSTVEKIRSNIWNITGKMEQFGDRLRRLAGKLEDGVKAIVTPGILFEAFGFKYYGPIDGNNVKKLVKMFKLIKDIKGPVFLHIVTKKGKGYLPAEQDSQYLHAIGKIDKETGQKIDTNKSKVSLPSYSAVFGQAMLELCKKDDKLTSITAAMPDGTGLDILQKEFPEKVVDVGIAEGHAVTFAAGLAAEGIVPVVAIYSTFLQRAYDHIIHDCALQNLHVVFALDRAGLVGADGPTHHGVFDISYLRMIPNMMLMAPKDEQELRDMLYTAIYEYKDGPVAIRFPRGNAQGNKIREMKALPLGKSETLKKGKDIAVISIGTMVDPSLKAAEKLEKDGISVEVINARYVKPLDEEMLIDVYKRFDKIMTIEEGQLQGGFGSSILEYVNSIEPDSNEGVSHSWRDKVQKAKSILSFGKEKKMEVYRLGIPDEFISHGTQAELLADLKMDVDGIYTMIKEIFEK